MRESVLKSLAQCLTPGWHSVNIDDDDDDEYNDNIDIIQKPE